ncbi:MAG: heme-binding protein, partial [Nitrososphaera sp.]|nr:heme-binding protein [Nitrososphaera sp.]
MKYLKSLTIILLLFILTAVTSQAQVVEKKGLTLDGAKKVIAAVVAEAKAKNAPGGTIAVVDDGGNLIALERLDNTFAASANIAIGKARTAAIFKRSTKVFEEIVNKGRTTMVALPDFTPLQGGIPIEYEGNVIGAIGVSGAASAQQDEELAMVGANALKSPMAGTNGNPASSEVTYIESKKVAEGFAKGAVLVGNDEVMMHASRNYMVHTSRREAPGMAEIHELDTDIIYVLDGSATFITGGTAVDTKPTAPNEIRGTSIQDGQVHHLSKGDVVIVPSGTPHWFKEVQGPL